jgi:hypothetical protein
MYLNYGYSSERGAAMDDNYRLKIKLGADEFEAEGPIHVVQSQFSAFKQLIEARAAAPPAVVIPAPTSNGDSAPKANTIPAINERLDKIMQLSDRVISLTARPDSPDSAVLLLLYGQKMLRQNDSVTGGEIVQGVTATGGLAIGRVDRLLDKLAKDGDVIVIGERRSRRYRLTNAGLAKARNIASELLKIVA